MDFLFDFSNLFHILEVFCEKMTRKIVIFKSIDIVISKGKRTAVSYFVYILEITSTFCVVSLSIANKQIFVLC